MPNLMNFLVTSLGVTTFLAALSIAEAKVGIDPIFNDHMVLQRGRSVPVWGTADAGEKVTVTFGGQTKTTQADKDGKWRVDLDAMKASANPQTMTVGEISIKDVLVGDVWVGSGQSNMAGGCGYYAKRNKGIAALYAAAPYPLIRQARGNDPEWKEATTDNLDRFSAILFPFGVGLQKELDVPIGLILSAVGGTPSGRWLSPEVFQADEACQAGCKTEIGQLQEALSMQMEAWKKWEAEAAVAKAAGEKLPRRPKGGKNLLIGDLYAHYIEPVIPYAIRGVLWDQGEAGTAVPKVDQFTLMGALIRGWREDWGQGDFPFLYVQKPSGGGSRWDPENNSVTGITKPFTEKQQLPESFDEKGGAYRVDHVRILQHPNTFMATSSDLGGGVHPGGKSKYALRACRVAFGAVYGKDVEIYGPIYDSHTIEGGTIRITFKHVGSGLAFSGGEELRGFQIADASGKYHWADATIDGKTVVLSCDKVAKPVAARYGWAKMRPWANLFNRDGLPALTFQTARSDVPD